MRDHSLQLLNIVHAEAGTSIVASYKQLLIN